MRKRSGVRLTHPILRPLTLPLDAGMYQDELRPDLFQSCAR